jgi:hypothetical protein
LRASHRLSSLAARAWPSPWLDASNGFFSLVVAVPVTQSKLLVVLTAAFAALLLNDVSIGSCFKILGNLNKKNRISVQPKKKRVNAAKLNNARFTCSHHMSIFYLLPILRQSYDNNLINFVTFFEGKKNPRFKTISYEAGKPFFGSGSRFITAVGSGIGFGIQIGIQRGKNGLRERLFYEFIRYLHSWMSLCRERKNTRSIND